MPTLTIKADLGRFAAALKNVQMATRKTEVQIVNRAARNIAFRAASFTPKAEASAINRELSSSDLLRKLAIISLRKKLGTGKGAWGSRAEARKKLSDEMKRIKARRKAGAGALRAGWIPAIQRLGGTYRGAKLKSGGSAAAGTAIPATAQDLIATIINEVSVKNHAGRVFTADQIPLAVRALERAVAFVTEDMEGYAIQKINETLQQQSD